MKSVDKRKEMHHAQVNYPKLESSKYNERIQGSGKDGLGMTRAYGPTKRGRPVNNDQEYIRDRHPLDVAVLIDQYFETGTLHLRESNIFGILRLAFELKLMDVYNACVFLLSHSVKVGNCMEIWQLSKKFQSYTLTEQVMNFMKQHLTTSLLRKDQVSVVSSLLYSAKDLHSLQFLLQYFSSHSNKDIAKAKGSITKLFFELMKQESMIWRFCFRECLQQFDDTKQMQDDDCQSSKTTYTLNNRMKERNTEMSVMNVQICSIKGLGKKDRGNFGRIQNGNLMRMMHNMDTNDDERKGVIVAGGVSDKTHEALDAVFLYEPKADIWTALPRLTHARFNHTMVTVNGEIYVIGGKRKCQERTIAGNMKEGTDDFDNTQKTGQAPHPCTTMSGHTQHRGTRRQFFMNKMNKNCHVSISPDNSLLSYHLKQRNESSWLENNQTSSVEMFSTDSNEWCEVSSMILHRKGHSSVVVGNSVYVLGGHDGVTQLCSMEKYNTVKDEWTLEKPLSRLCTGMSVVTDGQFLYVLGGYSRYQWLNTLSCYDIIHKVWIDYNHQTMESGRAFAGAELVAEDIFIFGGVNSQGCLDDCEVFNLTNKTWRQGPRMNQPRCNAGHCLLGKKIFVFGGEACGVLLDTVEYLDIENWEWKMVKKMPMRTAGLRCVQTNAYL